LDTLAEGKFVLGDKVSALKPLRWAAKLDPAFNQVDGVARKSLLAAKQIAAT
jgi:hypothetical protein